MTTEPFGFTRGLRFSNGWGTGHDEATKKRTILGGLVLQGLELLLRLRKESRRQGNEPRLFH